MRLRRVFDQHQAEAAGDLREAGDVRRLAELMNCHDGARPARDDRLKESSGMEV